MQGCAGSGARSTTARGEKAAEPGRRADALEIDGMPTLAEGEAEVETVPRWRSMTTGRRRRRGGLGPERSEGERAVPGRPMAELDERGGARGRRRR